MREYVVGQTSVTFRLTFDKMLPMLPGPGTAAFAGLIRGLQPYSISPSGITLDASSSNLADIILSISISEKKTAIRFTFEYFEMFVRELFEGDEIQLIDIANHAFNALKEIDVDFNQGNVLIRTSSHLRLPPSEVRTFLQEHLRLSEGNPILQAEAAAYKIELRDTQAHGMRVVLAESLAFKDAIFMDLSREYKGIIIPEQIVQWGNEDFDSVCKLLGLKEGPGSLNIESHD